MRLVNIKTKQMENTPEISSFFYVGNKVFFNYEKLPYVVMAVSKRYAVVVRKLNRRQDAYLLHYEVESGGYCTFTEAYEDNKKNPIYSLIDFQENKKAPDNLIFGNYNYWNKRDCRRAIKDLELGDIELSHRDRVELSVDVVRTKSPKQ